MGMTDDIGLRRVTTEDLDLFDRWFQSREGASEFQWFGHFNSNPLRVALAERQLLGGDANMLTVALGDRSVGRVEWLQRSWGRRDTSSCWEIAIGILPEFRGKGVGTMSQRMLVDYLFRHSRVERVQATTDPANVAEITCLERVGFQLEGRIRRAQWRDGAWHDQLLYSLLRDEFSAAQEG
jgi:aminoglycoside 6'-N-acetyltransferase